MSIQQAENRGYERKCEFIARVGTRDEMSDAIVFRVDESYDGQCMRYIALRMVAGPQSFAMYLTTEEVLELAEAVRKAAAGQSHS